MSISFAAVRGEAQENLYNEGFWFLARRRNYLLSFLLLLFVLTFCL